MRHIKHLKIVSTFLMVTLPLSVVAQGPMVYPAQGQTPDQMSRDRYECHMWAVQQSSYDPTSGGSGSPSSGQQGSVGREALRGGLRGAAAGAAIGAIAGDAGKGAAIGATAGGMKRAFGQRDANQAGASTAANQAENNYNRALGACMTGRGYSVQ
jgi:hypothetical protein